MWNVRLARVGIFAFMISSCWPSTPAIEWDDAVKGKARFADRALLRSCILVADPLVNTWPAIEVAAECNNGFSDKIQADIAFKATVLRVIGG